MDFRIPANIILAAAILLRMKSSVITMPEYDIQDGELAGEESIVRPDIIVDPLSFRQRIAPRRRISLNELITALDEAIKIKDFRTTILPREPISIPISLENFDIEAETEKIQEVINKNVDSSDMITFSHLSLVIGTDDVLLGLFIPLLFLAHKEKIELMQAKFFSELIIRLK